MLSIGAVFDVRPRRLILERRGMDLTRSDEFNEFDWSAQAKVTATDWRPSISATSGSSRSCRGSRTVSGDVDGLRRASWIAPKPIADRAWWRLTRTGRRVWRCWISSRDVLVEHSVRLGPRLVLSGCPSGRSRRVGRG
jgi:hypothetical protein